jgi:hypothetical protein
MKLFASIFLFLMVDKTSTFIKYFFSKKSKISTQKMILKPIIFHSIENNESFQNNKPITILEKILKHKHHGFRKKHNGCDHRFNATYSNNHK